MKDNDSITCSRNKDLTLQEREIIEKFHQDGVSAAKISDILKRGKNTVSRELRFNSIDGIYNAKKAQKTYEKRLKEGFKKTSRTLKNHENYSIITLNSLSKKIDSLESHLEIILDYIKELR